MSDAPRAAPHGELSGAQQGWHQRWPAGGLRTARLHLDRFTHADAAFLVELLNEPAFHQHIGDRGVRTLEDAHSYLEKGPLASYAEHGIGLWRVSLQESGETIGMCGLLRRDTLPAIDLGYAFLARHWGHGYALEAAAASLDFARRELAANRVLAIVAPANSASLRLLAKLGFRHAERRGLGGDGALVEVLEHVAGPEEEAPAGGDGAADRGDSGITRP